MTEIEPSDFASTAAIFVFGDDLRVVCWNDGAEQLTGIPKDDAVGRPCWEVIGAHDDRGDLVCHRGCSRARLVREGRCVPSAALHVRTQEAGGATGRRRVSVETISARSESGPLYLHVMRDAPAVATEAQPAPTGSPPRLTPRQREILAMLGDGHAVKAIAQRLGLMETTVRNHVRLLFVALGAHSQLEAVARARAFKLL